MLYVIRIELQGVAAIDEQATSAIAALREQGRLVLAGALPAVDSSDPGSAGLDGELIVAEWADRHAAERWAAECFPGRTLHVSPFKKRVP
jgi:uncharacterized protein YciI